MKGKFTSADVRAILAELLLIPGFIGSRVVNIYDLSQKSYIFKFATASDKVMLLVDAGFRFHITTFQRVLPDSPSPFTMILRKLRRKRLDSATQLGFDRVIDLQFSGGDGVNHLLLEFYASGNIVLTDENYEVLALLRSHQFEEDVILKVGEIYPVNYATQLSLHTSPTNWNVATDHPFNTYDSFIQWLRVKVDQALAFEAAAAKEGKKKGKPWTLLQLLLAKDSGVSYLGPDFLLNAIKSSSFDPNWKLNLLIAQFTLDHFETLCYNIEEALTKMESLRDHSAGGYIIYNEKSVAKCAAASASVADDTAATAASTIEPDYEEFTPLLFAQHIQSAENTRKYFKSFNETVDTYFFRSEEQKLQREWQAKEDAARKKLQNVQEEHERMLQGLGQQQRDLQDAAMLLEVYAEEVDKVCLVINSALQAELTWPQIEDMVAMETRRGNPIASLISRLKLADNMVVLKLSRAPLHDEEEEDEEEDEDDDDAGGKVGTMEVEIDLSLSAHANVSRLYTSKKAAYAKEVKTATAASKVMDNLKQQTTKLLESAAKKPGAGNAATPVARKVHWFEKFNWFITSEGFLVLSGRDAHQNDQLIRRYLRPEDVYVHADLAGAASCVVKARRQNAEDVQGPAVIDAKEKFFITPLAIQEAGVFAVCRSRAWQAKLLTSAYWVRAGQVSKKAPSGEYLSTGSFMIYGKKNFLPPMPLEMGFGLLFRVADEHVARHSRERRIKAYDVESEAASTIWQESEERYGLATGLDVPSTWTEQEQEQGGEVGRRDGQEEDEDEDEVDLEQSRPLQTIPEQAQEEEDEEEADNNDNDNDDDDDEEAEEEEDSEREPASPLPAAPPAKTQPQQQQQKTQQHHAAVVVPAAAPCATVVEYEKVNPDKQQPPSSSRAANAKGGSQQKNQKGGAKQQQQQQQQKDDKKKGGNKSVSGRNNNSNDNNSGSNKGEADDDEEDRMTVSSATTTGGKASSSSRKKTVNKKKARRYAEQDDEDRELAMLVLGHASKRTGETLQTQRQQQEAQAKQEYLQLRQEKVGVTLLQSAQHQQLQQASSLSEVQSWVQRLSDSVSIQEEWTKLFIANDIDGVGKDNGAPLLSSVRDIADAEIRSFSILPESLAMEVLTLFRDGLVEKLQQGNVVQQKSHFLAGIIRRILRNREVQKVAGGATGAGRAQTADKAAEQDEGYEEEEEEADGPGTGEQDGIDELSKLIGAPHVEDKILYAVPVCGPYLSLQSLRYKVKLTPGTIKKGKAVKTAVELFARGKEVTMREKQVMKTLTDNELVAVMIGEVKLSMPGLQQQKQQMKKKAKRGG